MMSTLLCMAIAYVQYLLYGSVARGEATADSDIDVLVVLKERVLPVQEIRRMADIRHIFY
ncbi:nucleotidyltransferase domain-containing protein [Pseudanabaena galeata UHCC 0370]|uniref:Nucleotidyltransferase domain-containing protein n=1 Tax=Pseudanabaena galeata UHCC 0370 TaxID=3110310 RepID=A0ABU5TJ58_9CYAN|nr:nucleotidyltransferase domain-containing protein [Pseudanabaena galeata]MEA5478068.1 nucleotidyltransferase domain-containing protein [Pseudanabaena galeata UHCC 0370]